MNRAVLGSRIYISRITHSRSKMLLWRDLLVDHSYGLLIIIGHILEGIILWRILLISIWYLMIIIYWIMVRNLLRILMLPIFRMAIVLRGMLIYLWLDRLWNTIFKSIILMLVRMRKFCKILACLNSSWLILKTHTRFNSHLYRSLSFKEFLLLLF